MARRAVRIGVLAAAIGAGLVVLAGFAVYDRYVGPGPLAAAKIVIIPKGARLEGIAEILHRERIIAQPVIFRLGARAGGRDRLLKAGEYEFTPAISMGEVVALLVAGRTYRRRLTIAEGLTTREVLALVRAAQGLTARLPLRPVAEGGLLPETYFYSLGDTRAGLVARMEKAMADEVARLWRDRAAGLTLDTPAAAVVLASMIEKETAVAAERPLVSAVFHNRLRRGMRLQSDPTVVYALTRGQRPLDRKLMRVDLTVRSPYNTYVVAGLPPGPIANPGRQSLRAALAPAVSDELYFVADGAGGHLFAATLAEHNRNVVRLRRLQRERRAATGK